MYVVQTTKHFCWTSENEFPIGLWVLCQSTAVPSDNSNAAAVQSMAFIYHIKPKGHIPLQIMLCCRCVLNGKNEAELARAGECPLDPGGYFIVRVSATHLVQHDVMSYGIQCKFSCFALNYRKVCTAVCLFCVIAHLYVSFSATFDKALLIAGNREGHSHARASVQEQNSH